MNSNLEMKSVVTKKDLNKVFWRWALGSQMSWNYETMQSGGVVLALGPVLRKIYTDDEEYKQAMDSHFAFFNTNPWIGNIIMGATIAVEESHEAGGLQETREAVASIKTGLMGPLAGIGDAILFIIPMTIFGALAGYMAQEGSALGILFGLAYCFVCLFVRRWMLFMGYKQGNKFVTSLSGQLKSLTHSASILGLMVVGALISSTISINIPFVFTQGDVKVGLQDTLNQIMPNLVPALLVVLVYWLLGKKNFTSTKAICLLLLIAFAGSLVGLFGA